MPGDDAYQRFQPVTRSAWRMWLATNHEAARGVWVVTWKQGLSLIHISEPTRPY